MAEHKRHGPLAGVRVLEIGGIGPGPLAAMVLGDLGAEVVRVDRPNDPNLAGNPAYNLMHRGRRSIIVDLRRPGGPAVIRRLATTADIVTEGYRPGVAERLGIGPDDLLAANPRLVYGRMTGWGQDGPLARTAGHDITYLAITGVLHAIGRAAGPPQVPLNLLGDFGAGSMFLVTGLLAALFESRISGKGQVVDAAIVDGVAVLSTLIHGLLAEGRWTDQRGHNLLDTGAPFYDVYETADGRHMAVGAIEPQFYAEFVRLIGAEEQVPDDRDPRRWPELRRRFAEIFRSRTLADWTKVFQDTDACVAPVMSLAEAAEHPQLSHRGTFVTVDGVRQPAPAPRFSRTPTEPGPAPPKPGVHTVGVLRDWGVGEIDNLLDEGAVIQT